MALVCIVPDSRQITDASWQVGELHFEDILQWKDTQHSKWFQERVAKFHGTVDVPEFDRLSIVVAPLVDDLTDKRRLPYLSNHEEVAFHQFEKRNDLYEFDKWQPFGCNMVVSKSETYKRTAILHGKEAAT